MPLLGPAELRWHRMRQHSSALRLHSCSWFQSSPCIPDHVKAVGEASSKRQTANVLPMAGQSHDDDDAVEKHPRALGIVPSYTWGVTVLHARLELLISSTRSGTSNE
ncbi:hypothetical protein E4U54_003211 [Claviceps lovelessii]|nr:hypothetical protein E4U54_003211 [Claviceps lovelessii]